ncbi:MAG: transcription-repair coupling factor [Proteobacteria bacterium]|nr:transcription-repair coupling factor [Pseudomonadota bacterium]
MNLDKIVRLFRDKKLDDLVEHHGEKELSVSGIGGGFYYLFLGLLREKVNGPFIVIEKGILNCESTKNGIKAFFPDGLVFSLYYEGEEISPEQMWERINALYNNNFVNNSITVIDKNLLDKKVRAPGQIKNSIIGLNSGDKVDYESLRESIIDAGYTVVSIVRGIGDVSFRGEIIDIFSLYEKKPVRIDIFDDRIDSIKEFDIITQRTFKELRSYTIFPIIKMENEGDVRILDIFNEGTNIVQRENLIKKTEKFNLINIGEGEINFNTLSTNRYYGNWQLFKESIAQYGDYAIEMFTESDAETRRLKELLSDHENIDYFTGKLDRGFISVEKKLAVFSDREIFARKYRRRETRYSEDEVPIDDLYSMEVGEYVVHRDYGIGMYRGLKKININGKDSECLVIYYQGDDKVFVPVERLNLVSRYISDKDTRPRLSSIGTNLWKERKNKVKKALLLLSEELLKLYAEREVKHREPYGEDTYEEKLLESTFEYEETEDQMNAIEFIKKKMTDDKVMNVIVVGEVGFGKTEVAIRASLKAVMNGKQVVVLAPTTILAEQHYNTFTERLKEFPVNVGLLSRFVAQKEVKRIIEMVKDGRMDILIGTHKVFNKEIRFANLGLLIIDEEHKFGVKHKEKIKSYKKDVDVIEMTATPIPRTLQMALSGFRDMIKIQTPPTGRMPVITKIVKWNDDVLRDIILREIERGGQVFFLHNRVETIYSIADRLMGILPDMKIAVSHGQMKTGELEKVINGFIHKKTDILVTTAIIESGIDMPNVNTIIINEAQNMGIAQLHQLRGRVGRAEVQAYCYLVVPDLSKLNFNARKRLNTIASYWRLGSGYKLALRDLEIRGAGTLLGERQHGHIAAIGYEMYMKLLNEAISEIKGEPVTKYTDTEIDIPIEAYIPENYIDDQRYRTAVYKRLNEVESIEGIGKIAEELIERYGQLPVEARNILELMKVKLLASRKFIKRIRYDDSMLSFEFPEDFKIKNIKITHKTVKKMEILQPFPLTLGQITDKKGIIGKCKNILQNVDICDIN